MPLISGVARRRHPLDNLGAVPARRQQQSRGGGGARPGQQSAPHAPPPPRHARVARHPPANASFPRPVSYQHSPLCFRRRLDTFRRLVPYGHCPLPFRRLVPFRHFSFPVGRLSLPFWRLVSHLGKQHSGSGSCSSSVQHSTAAQLGELGDQHQPAVFGAHRATCVALPGDARKHAATTAKRADTELCAPLVAYHPGGCGGSAGSADCRLERLRACRDVDGRGAPAGRPGP